jgi:hypothetical protein
LVNPRFFIAVLSEWMICLVPKDTAERRLFPRSVGCRRPERPRTLLVATFPGVRHHDSFVSVRRALGCRDQH